MQIQISPNSWSCLATSFAIALDTPVRVMFEIIGHNGSEIIFQSEEPYSRRAFHPQEFVDICYDKGFIILSIEALPITAGDKGRLFPIVFKEGNGVRLARLMNNFIGVVAGENQNGKPHAMAWDRKMFYDPGTGNVFEDTDFSIREFFALIKRKE